MRRALIPVLLAFAALAAPADAADVQIQMLNKGTLGPMSFEPAYVKLAPGDTVTFVPTDKLHNAETIPGLLPDGATPFLGKHDEQITVAFDVPGAYAIECKPHFGMGMVALVVVGDAPANIEAIRAAKLPGLAKKRMDILLGQAGF